MTKMLSAVTEAVIPGQAASLNPGSKNSAASGSRVHAFGVPRDDDDENTSLFYVKTFVLWELLMTDPWRLIPKIASLRVEGEAIQKQR